MLTIRLEKYLPCYMYRDSESRDQQLLLDQDTSEVVNFDPDLESPQQPNTVHDLLVEDYHESVVSVCGVLLPRATVEDTAKVNTSIEFELERELDCEREHELEL